MHPTKENLFVLAIVSLLFMPSATTASEAFNSAIAKAYGPYRAAASYLRTGNPGLASLELSTALDAWRQVEDGFLSTPPAVYADDPNFDKDLKRIGSHLELGLSVSEDGDAKAALHEVKPIRAWLYNLRTRNGVRLYADCITDMNALMAHIGIGYRKPPDLGDDNVRSSVVEDAKTYKQTAIECFDMAPSSYLASEEFGRISTATIKSASDMVESSTAGETGRYVRILGEIRSLDRILYFKFGG